MRIVFIEVSTENYGYDCSKCITICKKILPLLVTADLENISGTMFNRHGDSIYPNPFLTNKTTLKNIIEASEKLLKKAKL